MKELDRRLYHPQPPKHAVDITLGIAAEKIIPDNKYAPGNRRCVKNDGEKHAHATRQIVDKPSKKEREQKASRADDDGKSQRVLKRNNKNIVM